MFERLCPECKVTLQYASKGACDSANKKGSICRKCASIKSGFTQRFCSSENSGPNNPFFGKTHSEKTKQRLREERNNPEYAKKFRTDAFRQKISDITKGNKNPMYGKTYYEKWVLKYGTEEANNRLAECKIKNSKRNSGSGNPMYGKVGKGGYGWKGWYKNVFFRSIRELSYIINVLEKESHKWVCAETSEYRIKYVDYFGKERTYTPDFLVDDSILVEVKPSRLHNTPLNTLKKEAAVKFCNSRGWTYQITDVILLTNEEIKQLYIKKLIKFTDKYDILYRQKYCS